MPSQPDQDANTIRNKRLARLQAYQRPASASTDGLSDSSPSSLDREDLARTHLNSTVLSTATITTSAPLPRSTPVIAKPSTLAAQEAWEDRTLRQIFKVALEPGSQTQSGEYRLLEELRQELELETMQADIMKVPYISVALLDQLILFVCTAPNLPPLDYLVGCWRRVVNIQRTTPPIRLDLAKHHVLKEARRVCVSYILYCITIPDMFGPNQRPVSLHQRLLVDAVDADDERGIPQELLSELVARFDEEPDIVPYFAEAMKALSTSLSNMDLTDNFKPYIYALARLVAIKRLANQFTSLDDFLPSSCVTRPTAERIEQETLLGPFFRISPLQKKAASTYFSGINTKEAQTIDTATTALRLASQTHQEQLHQIIMSLVRASEISRSRVLDYFAEVHNMNKRRGAIQVEPGTVASDGFMLNITGVLNRMCEPFMDNSFTKLDRIDIEYFRHNPRLDTNEETKVNTDEQSARMYYSEQSERTGSFITEIFFLNAASHHYSLNATETQYESLARDLPELEKNIQQIEADRSKYLNTPTLAVVDRHIDRLRVRLEEGIAYKHAIEVLLFDELFQARSMLFLKYLTTWLLRVVDPARSYPRKQLILPLPEIPPTSFSCLPEYFLEDVGACTSFVAHYLPRCIAVTQLDEFLIFCLTFLRMSGYVRTPSLKSKLVEIIFSGLHPYPGKPGGYLGDLIHGNAFVLQNLMHALMNYYIDIEKQYYEKFTVRYHISFIIKAVWVNQSYRDKLEQESRHNVDFFVRFVALLLNDVTYVLDNALPALAEIRKLQDELNDSELPLTSEERAEKEKALLKSEKDATSYMSLGNETVAMLKLFTSAIADAFLQPEIVSRLAGMLDYNLEAITGPRCRNLKVRDPEKYRFRPKELLSGITDVYLNLGTQSPFVEAIARDGRSYKPELFEGALKALRKAHLKSKEELTELETLAKNVAVRKRMEEEGDLELGEIPEEFTDPLLATLMEDPVILPSSRQTIDRQTIKSHLLSDPKDPFNRAPLKIQDVVPNVELKHKIDAWVAEQRRLAKKARNRDGTMQTKY